MVDIVNEIKKDLASNTATQVIGVTTTTVQKIADAVTSNTATQVESKITAVDVSVSTAVGKKVGLPWLVVMYLLTALATTFSVYALFFDGSVDFTFKTISALVAGALWVGTLFLNLKK